MWIIYLGGYPWLTFKYQGFFSLHLNSYQAHTFIYAFIKQTSSTYYELNIVSGIGQIKNKYVLTSHRHIIIRSVIKCLLWIYIYINKYIYYKYIIQVNIWRRCLGGFFRSMEEGSNHVLNEWRKASQRNQSLILILMDDFIRRGGAGHRSWCGHERSTTSSGNCKEFTVVRVQGCRVKWGPKIRGKCMLKLHQGTSSYALL